MPAWLIEAVPGLATLVGVPAITAALGAPVTPDGTVPLAGGLALLVLLSRRWPVAVLLVSVSLILSFRTAGLTGSGWVWPATAAFVSTVLCGRLWWAVGTGAVGLWFGWVWEWTVHEGPSGSALATVGTEALWLGAVLAGTVAYRNWRRWQDEVVARLRQELRERDLDAARRSAEERLSIAREVHDVVAHTLTVVGVQLRVAAESLDDAPEQSRAAIAAAQTVRSSAMENLRGLVGVLRGAPPEGLDALPRLVDAVASPGLAASLVTSGSPRPVPAAVELAVTRVVQEALTNVVRHAHASAVQVELHYEPSEVSVTVTDDGSGTAAPPGHGLTGLRERVSALGGSFDAGPGPGGGFIVRASLPVPAP